MNFKTLFKKKEEIEANYAFKYKLRGVSLNFELGKINDLKDFLILLEKGAEDVKNKIKELENQEVKE